MAQPWHSLEPAAVLDALDSNREGLSGGEARHRLEQYGPNLLPQHRKRSITAIVLNQFKSAVVLVLVAAGLLALLLQK